jgi:Trypsin
LNVNQILICLFNNSGYDPTTAKWPWHAFIYGNGLFISTGTLIKPQWILTSARMISMYKITIFTSLNGRPDITYFRHATFTVHLGSAFRLQNDSSRVVIATNQKYLHPNFSRTFLINNIALLKLPNEIVLGSKKNFIFFHLKVFSDFKPHFSVELLTICSMFYFT